MLFRSEACTNQLASGASLERALEAMDFEGDWRHSISALKGGASEASAAIESLADILRLDAWAKKERWVHAALTGVTAANGATVALMAWAVFSMLAEMINNAASW